ncbi:MAG: hypothetical protein ACD_73C00416G0002 [uncultured bacterium]|nr:MAG: hypothetical protein ACD_73C00416G0002 [uncultured bacterium]
MAIPPTGTNDIPPIDPKSFGMEDEDKSNIEVMKHRPWVTLSFGYIPEMHCPARLLEKSEQFARFSLMFDTHLKAPFNIPLGPLNGMPFDFTIAPTATFQTSLDGSLAVGGGGDMLVNISPIFQAYLKNEYQRNLADQSDNWFIEGGLRFQNGAYDGPVYLGFEFGFGGYVMTNGEARDPNGYFHVGGNVSF